MGSLFSCFACCTSDPVKAAKWKTRSTSFKKVNSSESSHNGPTMTYSPVRDSGGRDSSDSNDDTSGVVCSAGNGSSRGAGVVQGGYISGKYDERFEGSGSGETGVKDESDIAGEPDQQKVLIAGDSNAVASVTGEQNNEENISKELDVEQYFEDFPSETRPSERDGLDCQQDEGDSVKDPGGFISQASEVLQETAREITDGWNDRQNTESVAKTAAEIQDNDICTEVIESVENAPLALTKPVTQDQEIIPVSSAETQETKSVTEAPGITHELCTEFLPEDKESKISEIAESVNQGTKSFEEIPEIASELYTELLPEDKEANSFAKVPEMISELSAEFENQETKPVPEIAEITSELSISENQETKSVNEILEATPELSAESASEESKPVTETPDIIPELCTEFLPEDNETRSVTPESSVEIQESKLFTDILEITPELSGEFVPESQETQFVTDKSEITPELSAENEENKSVTEEPELSTESLNQETKPVGEIPEITPELSTEFVPENQETKFVTDISEITPELFTENQETKSATDMPTITPELSAECENQETESLTEEPELSTECENQETESLTEEAEITSELSAESPPENQSSFLELFAMLIAKERETTSHSSADFESENREDDPHLSNPPVPPVPIASGEHTSQWSVVDTAATSVGQVTDHSHSDLFSDLFPLSHPQIDVGVIKKIWDFLAPRGDVANLGVTVLTRVFDAEYKRIRARSQLGLSKRFKRSLPVMRSEVELALAQAVLGILERTNEGLRKEKIDFNVYRTLGGKFYEYGVTDDFGRSIEDSLVELVTADKENKFAEREKLIWTSFWAHVTTNVDKGYLKVKK